MNELVKTQRAHIEYLEKVCKEFEMMQDIAADKYVEQKNELAALRAERDELRNFVRRASAFINNLPDGGDHELVEEADAILAKYKE